ncbi:MAG: hypothetical protein IT305_10095 [Chloroflexi bacterium]|nr:hypothetical protein [Chloroflexota bacterium]
MPTSVAALLDGHAAQLEFRRIVEEIFPDTATEILATRRPGERREQARVAAFLNRVGAELFPVYEVEEYEQIVGGVPFIRNGWSYERHHDLDLHPGELLLSALCAPAYDDGARLALLDAAEQHVTRVLLAAIPEGGFTPTDLHARLDGTPYVAAAEFADWHWGQTETIFLDADDEIDVDVEWTHENVSVLAEQWQRAEEILDRITALTSWIEADLPTRFARLVDAVLERDHHLTYRQERRCYAFEITPEGIVAVRLDDSDAIPLPIGAAV